MRRDAKATMVQHLSDEFRLTPADAELALDRTYGGVVRAATALVATVVRWVACPELVNRDQRLRRSSRQCS